MRIAVFGTGGAGGYFGARLAQAGEEIIFIARGEHLRAIREHGLRVDSAKGAFVVTQALATDDPAQVGPVDVVMVGVKAWQIPDVARAIQPLVGPDTVVLPLQNGVEAPAQLAGILGAPRVIGGLCGTVSFVVGTRADSQCRRHALHQIRRAGWGTERSYRPVAAGIWSEPT